MFKLSKDRVALLLLLTMALPAWASYSQFCHLDGRIVSNPSKVGDCVSFEYQISTSTEYKSQIPGAGWGNCAEHVGKIVEVCVALAYQGDGDFTKGQRRPLWRDAIDMMVDGEMCTVVGYSAVDPNTVD